MATAAWIVLVLCAGSLIILLGRGEPPRDLALADGGAWLVSTDSGTLTQVSGPSERAAAAVAIPGGARHDLTVASGPSGVLVADRTTGMVHRIAPASLTASHSTRLRPGVTVSVAGDDAYAVEADVGQVTRLNPADLSVIGAVVDLPGGLGRSVQATDGTLWVPVPHDGTVVAVHDGTPAAPVRVTEPGHAIDVTVVDEQPVILDRTAGALVEFDDGGPTTTIPLPPSPSLPSSPTVAAPGLRAPDRTSGPLLPLVDPATGRLLLVDIGRDGGHDDGHEGGNGGVRVVDLDDLDDGVNLDAPAIHAGRVYIPDSGNGTVQVVDAATGRPVDVVPVAPAESGEAAGSGASQITVLIEDDQVWINNVAGHDAVVVGERGTAWVPKRSPNLPGLPADAARPLPPAPSGRASKIGQAGKSIASR